MKALLLVFVVLLASCATLDKDQCSNLDWQTLGLNDALAGHLVSRLDKHSRACAKYDLSVDSVHYLKGWRAGVVKFCSAQSAWEYALKGRYYKGSCSSEPVTSTAAASFLQAYGLGRQVYTKKREIYSLKTQRRKFGGFLNPEQGSDFSLSDRMHLSMDIDRLNVQIKRLYAKAASLGIK